MKISEHYQRATLELSHAAAILSIEHYEAGLPFIIVDNSIPAARNAAHWRDVGIADNDKPLILLPRGDLSMLSGFLTRDMRRRYLAGEQVTIEPPALVDTPSYIESWVYRLEHLGRAAILPEKVRNFYLVSTNDDSELAAEVSNFVLRQGGRASIINCLSAVQTSGRARVFRFMPNPVRLFPPLRLISFDAEMLIQR
jgi:hypothetical protein